MRDVRIGDSFTRQLRSALVASQGAVTRRHFETYVLKDVLHRFATQWEALPQLPGQPSVRVYIDAAYPLHIVSVHGRELPGGVIELYDVHIDWVGLVDPEADPE